MDWTSLALAGKTLTLIDETSLETYRFSDNGMAVSTIGTKGGPVAGPIFHGRIRENVLVISVRSDSDVFQALHSPSVRGNIVTVTRKSGDKARYELSSSDAQSVARLRFASGVPMSMSLAW